MPDFLLEIGCEEIPARMINAAEAELRDCIRDFFKYHSLSHAEPKILSTPRRLAALMGTSGRQPELRSKILGPSEKVAFSDGKPTKAAEAFAKKAGVSVDTLRGQVEQTEKGRYVYAETRSGGRPAKDILVEYLPAELEKIY